MARMRCTSCGGKYDAVLPDGMRYFHACAPATRVAVTRAGTATLVDLAALQPTDTVTVRRAGKTQAVLVSAIEDGDVRAGDVHAARDDARDENVRVVYDGETRRRTPAREGAGAVEIADA